MASTSSPSSSPYSSPRASQEMPRTPLSHRLGSLFSSRAASPALSERSATQASTARPAIAQTQMSNDETVRAKTQARPSINTHYTRYSTDVHVPPSPRSNHIRQLSRAETLSSSRRDRSVSPSISDEASELLQEALLDNAFDYATHSPIALQRPPPARLPQSTATAFPQMQAGSNQMRYPMLLDHLGRATFPSLAVTESQFQPQMVRLPNTAPTAFSFLPRLSSSPPRTSIDSLRSLQEQDRFTQQLQSAHVHTTAVHPPARGSTLDSFQAALPSSWWFNNKKDVDHLLHEDDQAETAEEEGSKIRQRYRSPKNPMVFCHGLLGFDSVTLGVPFAPLQITHWRGIKEVLEANGVEVLITRVPATSSPEERGLVLAETIRERYSGRPVHLIGHSMGGIDCRYVASRLQDGFKVLSVTTVGSPHRGSSFADYFLDTLGDRMPTMLSFLDMLPNGGGDGKAFESLTVDNMKNFNAQTPDAPGVQYFSWGAIFEPGLLDPFRFPHGIVLEREGPNDGLVSINSARWGTYRGTLQGVSHLDLVGWVNTARYTWAEWTGKGIKFKPATFYLEVADHLAQVVEGDESQPQGPEMDTTMEPPQVLTKGDNGTA